MEHRCENKDARNNRHPKNSSFHSLPPPPPPPPQMFDFRSPEDCAGCVSMDPGGKVFACGFSSGAVRVFQLPSTTMIAEHRCVRVGGVVVGCNGDQYQYHY